MTTTATTRFTRADLQRMAREELARHGYGHLPVRIGTARTRLGSMHLMRHGLTGTYTAQYMTLSSTLLLRLGREKARDTILHEIAHAIAAEKHGHHGHGAPWKRVCREIGADPSRTAHVPADLRPPAPYTMHCVACGYAAPYHRKPKYPASRYKHKGCGGSFRLEVNR